MGYNKASLDLMGSEEGEDEFTVVELSDGRMFVLELTSLEF